MNIKETFLDLYYEKTIKNKILKKYYFDIKYIANKQKLTYGNIINVQIYNENNKIQLKFNIIFNEKNIEINKIKNYDDEDYGISMLEYHLENKYKVKMIWKTIKHHFIKSNWLLKLFEILPLSMDLPNDININTYTKWLIDNGFIF